MVYMSSDNEIVVTTRTGQGYDAVSVAFSDLRYSHRVEEDLKAALGEAFGPIAFNTWADMGVIALLVFYFDQSDARAPDRRRRRCTRIVERVISTWEDRVAVTLEQTFGPAEGRRLFTRYIRTETRSGMYRESTRARGRAGGSAPARDHRGAARDARPRRHRRFGDADDLLAAPARPDRRRCARSSTSALPVQRGAVDPADAARRPHASRSSACKIEAPPTIIAAMVEGEDRLLRGAARAPGGPRHRRSAERPDPDRGPRLARGRGAAHAAQPPAADPAGAERRDRQRRAAAQQRRRRRALSRLRRALRSRLPGPARSGDRARRRGAARRAARGRQPVRRRDPARAREPGARRRCGPTPISGPSGRWSRSRSRAARSTAWSRRGRCSRSTCTRASSKASTCAAARSRAAACAGAIATTTSAPRSSG